MAATFRHRSSRGRKTASGPLRRSATTEGEHWGRPLSSLIWSVVFAELKHRFRPLPIAIHRSPIPPAASSSMVFARPLRLTATPTKDFPTPACSALQSGALPSARLFGSTSEPPASHQPAHRTRIAGTIYTQLYIRMDTPLRGDKKYRIESWCTTRTTVLKWHDQWIDRFLSLTLKSIILVMISLYSGTVAEGWGLKILSLDFCSALLMIPES